MHFSSGINRPPYEAQDGYLQVTSGCSHGKCEFCTFYKDAPFRVSPLEEIEADIRELAESGWVFKRLYLQGADPFILSYERLMEIADMVYQYLPWVTSIGGYARVDNLKNKSVDELRKLKEAGYSNFYFGNETGDDFLLERMNKGYKAEVIVEELSKLDEAGMEYICNFLGGLGGHGYGLSHARKSAEILNRLHPSMVYASELTLFPDTPLSKDVAQGKFAEATEEERFEELQEFIRCLEIKTVFKAEHVTLPVPIWGELPKEKEKLITQLEHLKEAARKGMLDGFRGRVSGL